MGVHPRSAPERADQPELHQVGAARGRHLQVCAVGQGGQDVGRAQAEPEDDLREAESRDEVSRVLRARWQASLASQANSNRPSRLVPSNPVPSRSVPSRYYYKSKVLLPVFGRRLVYKFGPNATGWMANESELLY